MRAAWCVAILTGVVALGCDKKTEPTTSSETKNAPSGETSAPRTVRPLPNGVSLPTSATLPKDAGPPIAVDVMKLIDEYKDQQIAADAKYRGKQIEVKVGVRKTGRTATGEPFIGSIYGSEREDPPIIMYVFSKEREADVAALKIGDTVTIIGTCTGRVNDGQARMTKGLEFHIKVENCQIKK